MIEIVRASAERSDCHFSLINIPFGIFKSTSKDTKPVVGTAIGDYVLDLEAAAQNGLFDGTPMEHHKSVFSQDKLNKFMEVGRKNWVLTRFCIQQLILGSISIDTHGLFHLLNDVQMLMPIEVGDYTDFYSSKEHATNVGVMFRGKENALNPNWTHMPIAYHGRASSIVVSGTSTHRPSGQIKNPASASPTFGLTKKLDYELEMAFVIGKGNEIGKPISVEDAKEHIFGVVLMNDWSARDIQAWEYVPLGPFLGKNFCTVISPWIVTLDALEPLIVEGPEQDPKPLPYLLGNGSISAYNIELLAQHQRGSTNTTICRTNLKFMYWTFAQQLAHHTCNGCNLRPGDLCGTGTISGPSDDSLGSLLELTNNGQSPVKLDDGGTLTFAEDGDIIVLGGSGRSSDGHLIGFGTCVCPVSK